MPMPLTFVGDSNPVAGTTTTTASDTLGAGSITDGDYVLMHVVNKRPAVTPSTPTGWTLVATAEVGSGTPGAGDGPLRITIFSRIWVSGDTVPAIANSGTGAVISAGLVVYRREPAANTTEVVFSQVSTAGSDTTADTSWSATGAALTLGVGHTLLAFGAITSTTPDFSGTPTITASGITFDTVSSPYSTSTGSGDDLRSFCYRTRVTAGVGTVAPTLAGTLTSGTTATGGVQFLRLRIVTTYTKDGGAVAGAIGRGTQSVTSATVYTKSGTGFSGAVAAGSRTVSHPVAGSAVAAAIASGTKTVTPATTYTKSGAGFATGAPAGTRCMELPRAGAGWTVSAATGTEEVEYPAVVTKDGVGFADGIGEAPTALFAFGRTGGALAGAATTGSRAQVLARNGSGFASGLGSGTVEVEPAAVVTKDGVGFAGTTGDAPSPPRTSRRSGGALGSPTATGARASELARSGTGFARGIGTAPPPPRTYRRSGGGQLHTSAIGSKVRTLTKAGGGFASGATTGAADLVPAPRSGTGWGGSTGVGTRRLSSSRSGAAVAAAVGAGTHARVLRRSGGGFAAATTTGTQTATSATVVTKDGTALLAGVSTGPGRVPAPVLVQAEPARVLPQIQAVG